MMTYVYDPDARIIHLRAHGILVKDDPIAYFQALDQDDSFQPGAEERIYFQGLEDIAFTYKDIQEIAGAFEDYKHGDKIKNGIFLVDSDFTYGMARMIIAIFEPIFQEFRIERTE